MSAYGMSELREHGLWLDLRELSSRGGDGLGAGVGWRLRSTHPWDAIVRVAGTAARVAPARTR